MKQVGSSPVFTKKNCDFDIILIYSTSTFIFWIHIFCYSSGNLISVDGVLDSMGLEMVEDMDHVSHTKNALSPKSNDDSQEE